MYVFVLLVFATLLHYLLLPLHYGWGDIHLFMEASTFLKKVSLETQSKLSVFIAHHSTSWILL